MEEMKTTDFTFVGRIIFSGQCKQGYSLGCFSKDTLKENKKPNPVRYWGDLERIYPEGEGDRTSLGGRQRHLKFGNYMQFILPGSFRAQVVSHNSNFHPVLNF